VLNCRLADPHVVTGLARVNIAAIVARFMDHDPVLIKCETYGELENPSTSTNDGTGISVPLNSLDPVMNLVLRRSLFETPTGLGDPTSSTSSEIATIDDFLVPTYTPAEPT
jgi:hypothetical protein